MACIVEMILLNLSKRCLGDSASRRTHAVEVQNSTFSTDPTGLLKRLRDHSILRSGSASACRCPVMWRFPLFAAISDHNPRERKTDGRHSRSITATCDTACDANKTDSPECNGCDNMQFN